MGLKGYIDCLVILHCVLMMSQLKSNLEAWYEVKGMFSAMELRFFVTKDKRYHIPWSLPNVIIMFALH